MVKHRVNPTPFKTSAAIRTALDEWQTFEMQTGERQPSTLRAYKRDVEKVVRCLPTPKENTTAVEVFQSIDQTTLQSIFDSMLESGISVSSCRRRLSALRCFLAFASDGDAQTRTTVDLGVEASLNDEHIQYLPPDLFEKVRDAAMSYARYRWIAHRDAAILTLMYWFQLRIGHVLSIRKSQFIEPRETVLDVSSTGASREIQQGLLDHFSIYLDACPHRFSTTSPLFIGLHGKPLKPRVLQYLLSQVSDLLRLPAPITCSSLRRSGVLRHHQENSVATINNTTKFPSETYWK